MWSHQCHATLCYILCSFSFEWFINAIIIVLYVSKFVASFLFVEVVALYNIYTTMYFVSSGHSLSKHNISLVTYFRKQMSCTVLGCSAQCVGNKPLKMSMFWNILETQTLWARQAWWKCMYSGVIGNGTWKNGSTAQQLSLLCICQSACCSLTES